MAEKNGKANQAEAAKKLYTIEELAVKQSLRQSILVGMKSSYGWADGLAMTEDEFDKAKRDWLKRPVNGRN